MNYRTGSNDVYDTTSTDTRVGEDGKVVYATGDRVDRSPVSPPILPDSLPISFYSSYYKPE